MRDWWIQTRCGNRFSLTNPRLQDICIEDIAWSLSRQNRYVGHTEIPYYVAQHSVSCSEIVPEKLEGQGLMHDAAECYTGDISGPMKKVLDDLSYGRWSAYECQLASIVAERFGLPWPPDKDVKHADRVLMATEKRDLMTPVDFAWPKLPPPLSETIQPWGQETAYIKFLTRYKILKAAGQLK